MASFDDLKPFSLQGIKGTGAQLGCGSYGYVVKLEYMGLKCAGKIIHQLLLNQGKDTYQVRKYSEECHLLSKIHHPNIVQFLGVFFPKEETPGSEVPYLVMELLPTNLTSCINLSGILPNETSYSILHDVALGLHYLHHQSPPIIHRDMSSNNVLLTANMRAKIADLGVARIMSNLTPIHLREMTQGPPGTLAFMPPEVMVEHPKYNTSVDIFSYGVIMIHLFSGKWPEESDKHRELQLFHHKIKISHGKCYEQCLRAIGKKHPFKNLIEKCINDIPNKRSSIQEIVKQTSEMTSRFEFRAIGPKEMMMLDIDILTKQRQEKQTKIREKDQQHIKEMEKLQKECEELRIPLTTTKQPLQATITWKQCSPPPSDISSVQSTVINGKVYLGGEGGGVIYCYDPSEDNWNALPQLPVKDFGLGQSESKVVAIGGVNIKDNKRSNRLYTLTPHRRSHRWDEKRVPPMPTARSLVTVASLELGLLVAGGQTDTKGPTDMVELFKKDRLQWYKVDVLKLPTPCYNMSVAVSGDNLYLLGGYNGKCFRQNQTLCTSINYIANYNDPTRGVHWNTIQSTPRYQPLAVLLSDNLLAIGGWETATAKKTQKKVHALSPSSKSWVYVDDLPECLSWTTSATISSTEILVIGKNDGNNEIVYKGSLTVQMYT